MGLHELSLVVMCRGKVSSCSGFSCEAQALEYAGSVVVAHELSCPTACVIFPDQESNPIGRWILNPRLPGKSLYVCSYLLFFCQKSS